MIARRISWLLSLWLILLTSAFSPPALAEGKRVALVVGNSAYKHAAELRNPRNDAEDVAAALEKLGFIVITEFDLDQTGLRRVISRFAVAIEDATVAVFYYAGHGMQLHGTNYLVPTDSKLENQYSPELELMTVATVQRVMESKPRTNIIFLDACRDNPLARNLARAMGTRSAAVQPGLSRIESGIGTLISFSTQPGAVAQDGKGRNSPFAAALVRNLSHSTLSIADMLVDVRREVRLATKDRQITWEHSSLSERFYFSPPKPVPSPAERPVIEKEPLELTEAQKSELASRINRELKRVGCDPGTSAGTWTVSSQEALQLFAAATKYALYTDEPTQAALEALTSHKFIVCPQRAVATPEPAEEKPPAMPVVTAPASNVEAAKIESTSPAEAALQKSSATAVVPTLLQPEAPPAALAPPVPEKRPAPRARAAPRAASVKPPRNSASRPAPAPPTFATKVESRKKCRLEAHDECLRRLGLSRSEWGMNCARREICD